MGSMTATVPSAMSWCQAASATAPAPAKYIAATPRPNSRARFLKRRISRHGGSIPASHLSRCLPRTHRPSPNTLISLANAGR